MISEIAAAAVLSGKVNGNARRAMTPALEIRVTLPMTQLPDVDYAEVMAALARGPGCRAVAAAISAAHRDGGLHLARCGRLPLSPAAARSNSRAAAMPAHSVPLSRRPRGPHRTTQHQRKNPITSFSMALRRALPPQRHLGSAGDHAVATGRELRRGVRTAAISRKARISSTRRTSRLPAGPQAHPPATPALKGPDGYINHRYGWTAPAWMAAKEPPSGGRTRVSPAGGHGYDESS